ncbi:MAG: CRTAC1 family protein [Thermoanaerobaculia bacterium]|jgi:hypothetical protein|nr:CRTAC1 family protein [Thermoanaerobaculia bacterium]MBP9823026.1 CRTAC1 family protein [Thermoanaerobaculia bacterium]
MAARLETAARRLESTSPVFRVTALRDELAATPWPEEGRQRLAFALNLARTELYAGNPRAAAEAVEKLLDEGAAELPAEGRRLALRVAATARLRQAEIENCIGGHGPESCLFPLQGGGVHQRRAATLAARAHLEAWLAQSPDDATARWLLNITAMALGEWPAGVPEALRIPAEIAGSGSSESPFPRFRDVAMSAGLTESSLAGGVAAEDFDGDGLLDLVVSAWGPRDPLRLFAADGHGGFADRSEHAGFAGLVGGLNLNHADYDNDGDADLLILRGGWLTRDGSLPSSLLENDGSGRFSDVTEAAGLLFAAPTQTGAWADYDLDGDLDLFVGFESTPGDPHPCRLYRNRGDGHFDDVAREAGLDVVGYVKAAIWGDVDNDGRPDLFLSRFGEANLLFRNLGNEDGRAVAGARFADITAHAGVAEPRFSFPALFFDADDDGDLDLFVAGFTRDFFGESLDDVLASWLGEASTPELLPKFYRNRGDGTFEDRSQAAGLDRPILAMAANVADLDGDGRLDLYLGTGAPDFAALLPNVLLHNRADGRLVQAQNAAGVGHLQKGHGIAIADFDQDGDEDIYAVLGGAWPGDTYYDALFESSASPAAWVGLELSGSTANRAAIGARIELDLETPIGPRQIFRWVQTGGSFGSSSLRRTIALGEATAIRRLVVRWPGGGEESFPRPELARSYGLIEGSGAVAPLARGPFRLGTAGRHEHLPH